MSPPSHNEMAPQTTARTGAVTEVLRRKVSSDFKLEISGRRRSGAILMASIAAISITHLRLDYDPAMFLALEMIGILGLLWLGLRLMRKPGNPGLLLLGCLCLIPWPCDFLWRFMGNGNGNEILLLCSLAWASLVLALAGFRPKHIGLSVVSSGFLTLFTAFISDNPFSAVFAYAWGMLCLWWLVANQWELIETCQASHVSSIPWRFSGVAIGAGAFALVVFATMGRIPVLHELQAAVMPTSGGSRWTDPAARSGIGNGDALVAAKDHAMTFGAVDTDFFLDSPEPSLFDVFNDTFGEPAKKTRKNEQAQALSSENVRSDEGKFADSNRASSDSFSTRRNSPKQNDRPNELRSHALMFWRGEPGVRLCVERYHQFDGTTWNKDSLHATASQPEPIQIQEKTWFERSDFKVRSAISPYVGTKSEALKFTRYGSALVPSRLGLQLWSIDMLDRADFFSMTKDDCLSMPGRKKVPNYTVLRYVNSQISLSRLESLLANCSPGKSHYALTADCETSIAEFAHRYSEGYQRGWDQVRHVIKGLRQGFELVHEETMTSEQPVEEFLEKRQGNSYMFATTACLMLEHLGYRTRLAKGFYVDPANEMEEEYAILASNAHFWAEINVGHGYWVTLEPTPGFQQPKYHASLAYRLYKARSTIVLGCLASTALLGSLYLLRFLLFEVLCYLSYPLIAIGSDRFRLKWLFRVLDIRFSMIGARRPAGRTIRRQIQSVVESSVALGSPVSRLLQEADQLYYGHRQALTEDARATLAKLWRQLHLFEIKKHHAMASTT